MNKLILIIICSMFFAWPLGYVYAQGGVSFSTAGTPPDSSAGLDVNFMNKGALLPRMSSAERNAIISPAKGLTIFNTDCSVYNYNAGTSESPNWATINASNVLVAGVSIAANPIGAVCAGSNVTFTATPAAGINSPSYQWQVNGGNTGGNSATFIDSSLNNGDVVTCILSTNQNCVTGSPATSNSITLLVNTVPAITGTTPASFCNGSAVTLGASANLGTINWYANSTGGSSLSSGASFTVSGLTSNTTYYVDATANGCTTPSRTAVTATSYPNPPGEPGAISGPIFINENVDVNDTATYSISALPNTATYIWSVSTGTVTSGQGTTSIIATWGDSSSIGNVSVAANNPCGTSSAQTLTVDVGTQIFSYTGGEQTFTVPTNVTQITLFVYGAQGGTGNDGPGGLGGYATGSLSVTPGEALYIYVGGQPTNVNGGFNGGGTGYGSGFGGGGASDVRVGGTDLGSRIIVGGGGGSATSDAGWITAGGTGGGTSGGTGASNNGTNYCGQGGTQNGGGAGAVYYSAGAGSLGQGGSASTEWTYDPGGGGGYYGGGGGGAGGSGGGSGYTGGVNNGSMQNGIQSGNGQVVITW